VLPEHPEELFVAAVLFAKKWSELSGIPFPDAVFTVTPVSNRIFGKEPTSPEAQEAWKDLSPSLQDKSHEEIAHHLFVLAEESKRVWESEPKKNTWFGAFFYSFDKNAKRIRLHFNPQDRTESSLAKENTHKRIDELRAMFERIRNHHRDAETVEGKSWIYNLESYRRLFPPSFAENMPEVDLENISFTGGSVWGQFTKSTGGIHEERYERFLKHIEQANTLDELIRAFPFLPLKPKGNIKDFYKFYGITTKN
jgi:hypothetical protein